MPTLMEIFNVLKTLNIEYKYGIAGSYARGTAKLRSDIDIVVDTDSLDIDIIELIKKSLKSKFNKNSDVLCLELLRQEDIDLDNLAISVGLEPNEDSAYKSIIREVVWFDEVLS